MKKFSIVMAVMLVVMCCSCVGKSEDANAADSNEAQNEEVVDLGEILEEMEKEQPTATLEPTPEQEIQEIAPDEITFPEYEQVVTEEDQTEPQGHDLQLVFLGDSIFDSNRDGTGVPYLTSVQCDADVYNLAIGGTTATLKLTESAENEKWTNCGLMGLVKAMTGQIPTDIFEGTNAKAILDNPNIDFSQTDYFIIEYGINDYFEGAARSYDTESHSLYTYAGALRAAIQALRDLAPGCTIVLCPPHYCLFFNGDKYVGDSNVTDKGAGTLRDYMGTCEYISGEQQTLFLNTYYDLGIDAYTTDQYLEDGIHLTQEGRQIYADALARLILSHEESKNN